MSLKDFILLSFYAMVRQLAPGMAFSIAVLVLAGLIDHWWHKGERIVEEMLDTPQSKETHKKMEVLSQQYDENRKRKMCPFCGEIYMQDLIMRCIHCGYDLVDRPLPCTRILSNKQDLEYGLRTALCDEEADFLFDIIDTYKVDLYGIDGKQWQALRNACWTGQNPEQYINPQNGPLDQGFAMVQSVPHLLILAELRLHDSYHSDGESAA